MKRREMLRASVLAGAAAALRPALANAQTGAQSAAPPSELTPAQSGVDASKEFEGPGWKPLFLDEHQNETLETQRAFLNSLGYLDGESMKRYKAAFRYLSADDQDLLLHALAYPRIGGGWAGDTGAMADPGHAHFEALKDRIMTAYYSSQIGEKELGWDGAFAHGPYQGCEHPEGDHK
jgi:hypothetical protein